MYACTEIYFSMMYTFCTGACMYLDISTMLLNSLKQVPPHKIGQTFPAVTKTEEWIRTGKGKQNHRIGVAEART